MAYPVKVLGWKAHTLRQYSMEQLEQLMAVVEDVHRNPRNELGRYEEDGKETIHMIDRQGRRKLDAITWAIYHKTKKH